MHIGPSPSFRSSVVNGVSRRLSALQTSTVPSNGNGNGSGGTILSPRLSFRRASLFPTRDLRPVSSNNTTGGGVLPQGAAEENVDERIEMQNVVKMRKSVL